MLCSIRSCSGEVLRGEKTRGSVRNKLQPILRTEKRQCSWRNFPLFSRIKNSMFCPQHWRKGDCCRLFSLIKSVNITFGVGPLILHKIRIFFSNHYWITPTVKLRSSENGLNSHWTSSTLALHALKRNSIRNNSPPEVLNMFEVGGILGDPWDESVAVWAVAIFAVRIRSGARRLGRVRHAVFKMADEGKFSASV